MAYQTVNPATNQLIKAYPSHTDADVEAALKIIVNAKTKRPSTCNTVETLLVHQDIAARFLPPSLLAVKGKIRSSSLTLNR